MRTHHYNTLIARSQGNWTALMKTKNPCSKHVVNFRHFMSSAATTRTAYTQDTVSAMCDATQELFKEERGCPRRALSKDKLLFYGLDGVPRAPIRH